MRLFVWPLRIAVATLRDTAPSLRMPMSALFGASLRVAVTPTSNRGPALTQFDAMASHGVPPLASRGAEVRVGAGALAPAASALSQIVSALTDQGWTLRVGGSPVSVGAPRLHPEGACVPVHTAPPP